MTEHLDHVEGWNGSLEDLAKAVANMRYDAVAEFMGLLANEFNEQSLGDRQRGRTRLSARLAAVAQDTQAMQIGVRSAWMICEPYMRGDHESD